MIRAATLRLMAVGTLLGIVAVSANANEPYDLEAIQNLPFQPRGELHPKDFRDVNKWVDQLPQRGFDFGSVARRTLQLKQDNPKLSNNEIAETLMRDFPGLSTVDGLEQLQKWVQQHQSPQLDLSRMIPEIPKSGSHGEIPSWPSMFPPNRDDPQIPPEFRSMIPPMPGDSEFALQEEFPSLVDHHDAEMLMRRQRQYFAIKQFWERNFGPIDRSPALRQLLLEMFVGADPMNATASEGLSALLGDETIDPNEFLGWLDGQLDLSELQLSDLKLFDFGLPSLSSDDLRPGSFPAGDLAVSGSSFDWAEIIIVVVGIASIVAAYWYFVRRPSSHRHSKRVPGLDEWPIDPRTIADRAGVVTAFEYLSLSVCGIPARSWNHEQIAETFQERLELDPTTSPVNALVELYVIARYAPADDPFTPEMITDVRTYLCRLAGISSP